jgi:hypothetical protein
MEYIQGERKQIIIYARTLRSAKAQAKEIAKKNGIGIMYGLEIMSKLRGGKHNENH